MEGLVMSYSVLNQELESFAVELRRLAYTMPAGHEDRLIHLSDRMAARSLQTVEDRQRGA